MKRTFFVAMLLILSSSAIAQESSWWDRTKIGVLAFGDYYYLVDSHDSALEDSNGFWFRRIYLTFDHKIDDRLSARLRFEASHPGDFTSSANMDPFVKDAYVKYTLNDRHTLIAGIQSPPSFNLIEDVWGYRPLEKTPNDLFRVHSSRDMGLAAQGKLNATGSMKYHVMFGNGNGVRNENNEGKYIGASFTFEPNDRFLVQLYADNDDRPGNTDRSTIQGFAAWQGDGWRVGAEYLSQDRGSTDLAVGSLYGVFDLTESAALVARWDRTFDPVPDADRISYMPVASGAEVNLILVGVDLKLHEKGGLIPNVEYLTYDGVGGTTPDDDILPRLTFYLKF